MNENVLFKIIIIFNRLRPYNASTDYDYVHINTWGLGCKSYVGRKGGKQVISAQYCLHNGGSWALLAHEFMHVLGKEYTFIFPCDF